MRFQKLHPICCEHSSVKICCFNACSDAIFNFKKKWKIRFKARNEEQTEEAATATPIAVSLFWTQTKTNGAALLKAKKLATEQLCIGI